MIKKMYVGEKHIKKVKELVKGSHHFWVSCSKGGKYDDKKPVIVTDEDLFKNIRRQYEIFKHLEQVFLGDLSDNPFARTIREIWPAIKADLENFDKVMEGR